MNVAYPIDDFYARFISGGPGADVLILDRPSVIGFEKSIKRIILGESIEYLYNKVNTLHIRVRLEDCLTLACEELGSLKTVVMILDNKAVIVIAGNETWTEIIHSEPNSSPDELTETIERLGNKYRMQVAENAKKARYTYWLFLFYLFLAVFLAAFSVIDYLFG